jgi:hypothetical protein
VKEEGKRQKEGLYCINKTFKNSLQHWIQGFKVCTFAPFFALLGFDGRNRDIS